MNLNPKSIKIGNLLNHSKHGNIEVLGVAPHGKNYAVTIKGSWVYLRNCKGIPLNDNFLLGVGKTSSDRIYEFIINLPNREDKLFIKLKENNLYSVSSYFHGKIDWIKDIQFFHELQNLYSEITNRDLIIKENEKV
jgi:hypothetical protein